MESGNRGFELTGEDSFLRSRDASIAAAARDVDNVANLFGEMIIGLRRTQGFEATAQVIKTGAGGQGMAQLQGVVRDLQNEELRLLLLRDAEASRRLAQTRSLLIAGAVLGLLITGSASWSVRGVVILHDITERKRAEVKLTRSAEELRSSNQELERFALVASHDLQAPLRMVSGYIELIRRRYADKFDDDGREFIGYALDGADRQCTQVSRQRCAAYRYLRALRRR